MSNSSRERKILRRLLTGPDGIKAAGEKEGYDAGLEEGFKTWLSHSERRA